VLSGHAVHSRSPAPENESGAHCWQLPAESDALMGEYKPAPHGEHCTVPVLSL
jgi:hypothetical protein